MKKKKKLKKINYLDNLRKRVIKYGKHIPLTNLFISKKCIIENSKYGFSDFKSYKIKKFNKKIIFNNCISNNNEYIKCKQVILTPSDNAKNILLSFMEDYRCMYNIIVLYLNNQSTDKPCYNFRKIRNLHTKEKKKFKTPSHVLDGAIKLACASFKSALTNYKNGNIKHFKIKTLKQNKKSKVMDVEQCYFGGNEYIFKTFIKEKITNLEDYKYSEIKTDCKIHYNVKKDKFKLLVPIKTEINELKGRKEQISIDMGERTFITGLTNESIIEIGTNISKKIKNSHKRIDRYKRIIKNKQTNEKINFSKDVKTKKLKNQIKKIREKLKNQVKDMHWKIINYLTNNYKNIILGNWSTKGCVKKGKSKLRKLDKRVLMSLNVFKFKEKIKYLSEAKKVNLQIVEENYTTQMCSYCSNLKPDIGGSKVYECLKCKIKIDRDVNSCRNMELLGIKTN